MRLIDRLKLGALFALIAVLVAGVFSQVTSYAADKGADTAANVIRSVLFATEGTEPVLRITTSAATTYTSYKSSSPNRLVVDFSQSVPDEALAGLSISQGPVTAVTVKRFDTDAGVLTRMEVFLSQNIEPVITPVPEKSGELKIVFPGYKAIAPAADEPMKPTVADAPQQPQPTAEVKPKDSIETTSAVASEQREVKPAKQAELILRDVQAAAGSINIVTGSEVQEFKIFKLSKPERVVLDIPGAKTSMTNKLIQLNVIGISTVRVGAYTDKIRLVFDAMNGNLAEPKVERTAQGLVLSFVDKPAASGSVETPSTAVGEQVRENAKAVEPAAVKKVETQKPESKPAVKLPVATVKASAKKQPAQVDAIDFQVLDDVSRITIKAPGAVIGEPVKSAKQYSVRLVSASISKQLQRVIETRGFVTPVLKITPVQLKEKKSSSVLIKIALRTNSEISLKKEADIILIDVKHPEGFGKKDANEEAAVGQKAAPVVAKPAPAEPVVLLTAAGSDAQAGKHRYTGRKVTLEFADAEVRKIFQLLSEVSNKNFVLGDEVTGNISLKLVNVPWDQALDVIMDTKGLEKREEGSIVLIRGKGKFKSQMDEEAELRKAQIKSEPLVTEVFDVNYAGLGDIITQFAAIKTERGVITKDERTNKIIVKDIRSILADMRVLLKTLDLPERQVIIEARIVEAQTSFTRSLGVNWGLHYRDGSASILGVNSMDTTFGGITSAPATSGVAATAGGAAGISFGTLASNIKLDLRMSAAVTAGMLKIVSTPRIATLNNKQAKISQGYEVPYQTIDDKGNPKIEFKKVDLLLEVTPNINPNGTVNLKINAKNNNVIAGSTSAAGVPIATKEASTEMLLKDGETTVIGGIFVDTETDAEDGVPFLNELPFIGGLFKSTDKKKNRNELLIFITPRIMNING